MLTINCKNLEAEMKRAGVSRKNIADLLNLSYSTIHSRFNGNTPWLYDECVAIQSNIFPTHDLKYLFEVLENKTNTCSIA